MTNQPSDQPAPVAGQTAQCETDRVLDAIKANLEKITRSRDQLAADKLQLLRERDQLAAILKQLVSDHDNGTSFEIIWSKARQALTALEPEAKP